MAISEYYTLERVDEMARAVKGHCESPYTECHPDEQLIILANAVILLANEVKSLRMNQEK